MKVLIMGGGGFLGQALTRAVVARGGLADEPGAAPRLSEIVLFDQAFGPRTLPDERIRRIGGDVLDRDLVREVCKDADAVFHLASVVSAGAEADFDLGMRVNVDGMRNVLEGCRAQTKPPRLVFTSSVAAFGGELPQVVTDATAATPRSSYGTQKVIGELLVNDYARKGYLDGRTVRLPTIVIRPGKPNRAASGFMSSILREPINGEAAVCPVPEDAKMWIASPLRAVDALIHAIELGGDAWGVNRTVNAPGITVSVEDALAALERVAGHDAVSRVRFDRDADIQRIVLSWPAAFATERADRLGFARDESIEDIIRMHVASVREPSA
jgi:nucleoside-diphosphate-sugar epimerase